MMYSYYALSLMKISCPWKKYLTVAQLTQFATVIAYTGGSLYYLHGNANWKHYLAYAIQVGEMSSLFFLFLHFYRKAYSNKKKEVVKKVIVVASTEMLSTKKLDDNDGSQTSDSSTSSSTSSSTEEN